MSPLGRIFGPGRQIENLLKKAEAAFGSGEWLDAAGFASECRQKIDPDSPGKFGNELKRAIYLEAASLYKGGDIPASLEVIRSALELDDGLGEIAKLLAEISEQSEDHEMMVGILEAAVRRLPDNNLIALALCTKYVHLERFDEKSLPIFKRMLPKQSDNRTLIFGTAMCLRKLNIYDRGALSVYRRAFHEFSTNEDFLYGLAKTYSLQSPPINEALPVIERALKFYPDEESFQKARVEILSSLPALTSDQVNLLVETFKKSKDLELAKKIVGHLLSTHADDEDACRVYEVVWKDHAKRTMILSILAEKYRLSGRRDPAAVEIFQAFFEEQPREASNTLYLARLYGDRDESSEAATIVYQQALREGAGQDLDKVVLALANAYLVSKRSDEEAARVYRMAHTVEPDNYAILEALSDVAMSGGRMEGSRANPLITYIRHQATPEKRENALAGKLGPVLAGEGRTDRDAVSIYRMNVENKVADEKQEELLVRVLVENKEAKIRDIPLLERVYAREETDQLAIALADLYRQTGEPSKVRLPMIVRALELNPGNRELAGWFLPYLLNRHGEEAEYFPLIASLIKQGQLSVSNGLKSGVVSRTSTRIARDRIREGNFTEAIAVLSEAFKHDKDPILQYLLGVSYQGNGDINTGLGIFKNLLKSEKQNSAYMYRIAVLNMMKGDHDSAGKELKKLEKLHPDHPMIALRIGMIHELRGDIKQALEEYEKIKSGDKIILAFSAYRKGILSCANGEWSNGLKLLDRASGGGISTPHLEATQLLARITLADTEFEEGKFEKAEQHLRKITGNLKPPWPQAINERFMRLGIKYLEQDNTKAAKRAFESAVNTGVVDKRVAALMAMIEFLGGRPKAANERLDNALAKREKTGAELAQKIWAIIALKLGRHEDAREASDWLVARKADEAVRLRFLAVWRNPVEVDWPPALADYKYEHLETELGFPVGMIGRLAYKRADYEGGAKYLEAYFKDDTKPDRVEAEFLLGLMYIKLKKPNLGLHYWSDILTEGYKQLSGKQRIESLMLLGFHFLEHGEPGKSREAFKLAGDAGASVEEIDRAISFSHLQAGYMEAKSDNMRGAVREWEMILEKNPEQWQALQNLALAHLWLQEDKKAMEYFDRLYAICNENPEAIEEEEFSFVHEETRKMINQLVNLESAEKVRSEVKREMLLDEIKAANRHYWTLGVKKGTTSEEAQANYFRLIKIYNPEKYPQDFMVLEKAYDFFNKPGLLKKNEQKVFNAFHFRQLGLEEAGGLSEIPPSPSIVEYLKEQLDPRNHVNYEDLLEESSKMKFDLPELNTTPDLMVPDYLASW